MSTLLLSCQIIVTHAALKKKSCLLDSFQTHHSPLFTAGLLCELCGGKRPLMSGQDIKQTQVLTQADRQTGEAGQDEVVHLPQELLAGRIVLTGLIRHFQVGICSSFLMGVKVTIFKTM